jgi:hypothetical protein
MPRHLAEALLCQAERSRHDASPAGAADRAAGLAAGRVRTLRRIAL